MRQEEIIEDIYKKFTRYFGVKNINILTLLLDTIQEYQDEYMIIIDESYIATAAVIVKNYELQCCKLKDQLKRNLTKFEEAACLMYTTNIFLDLDDRIASVKVALDMAYKLCEIPYNNIDFNYNTAILYRKNMTRYQRKNYELLSSLLHHLKTPYDYSKDLEVLYPKAIIPTTIQPLEDTLEIPRQKKKKRFNPFKK